MKDFSLLQRAKFTGGFMPYCVLSNEKREYLIVHGLNQEHDMVTRRDVEFKIEGVKFC